MVVLDVMKNPEWSLVFKWHTVENRQPAFASIRKITPQAIPRLYNGICVCIVVNDRICVMAVRLTGANRVILQKVYDYAGTKT